MIAVIALGGMRVDASSLDSGVPLLYIKLIEREGCRVLDIVGRWVGEGRHDQVYNHGVLFCVIWKCFFHPFASQIQLRYEVKIKIPETRCS